MPGTKCNKRFIIPCTEDDLTCIQEKLIDEKEITTQRTSYHLKTDMWMNKDTFHVLVSLQSMVRK